MTVLIFFHTRTAPSTVLRQSAQSKSNNPSVPTSFSLLTNALRLLRPMNTKERQWSGRIVGPRARLRNISERGVGWRGLRAKKCGKGSKRYSALFRAGVMGIYAKRAQKPSGRWILTASALAALLRKRTLRALFLGLMRFCRRK